VLVVVLVVVDPELFPVAEEATTSTTTTIGKCPRESAIVGHTRAASLKGMWSCGVC
jgi:hypothetical protein